MNNVVFFIIILNMLFLLFYCCSMLLSVSLERCRTVSPCPVLSLPSNGGVGKPRLRSAGEGLLFAGGRAIHLNALINRFT